LPTRSRFLKYLEESGGIPRCETVAAATPHALNRELL
jgi:hypothetical protein